MGRGRKMSTNLEICNNGHAVPKEEFHLDLLVTDREVVGELARRPDPHERDDYARSALKVGVLAIRQASGAVDTRAIHDEGERLIQSMRQALKEHTDFVSEDVSTTLRKYFDPTGGELSQRIDRLVRRGGELEALLTQHVNGDG